MKFKIKKLLGWLLLSLMVLLTVSGCAGAVNSARPNTQEATQSTTYETRQTTLAETIWEQTAQESQPAQTIEEQGTYISKDEVALYLHTYNRLPDNYVTKKEAENQGWDSKKGNLQDVLPGKSIGGSHFGNYDKKLPEKKGRKYFECDINYEGGYRGAERIIYSNDGLVFYTGDHYETFEQLY